MSTSADIILDKRYQTKKGYPVKIRITNRGTKYVPLNIHSGIEHWGDGNVNNKHPDYRKIFPKINKRALKLTEELEHCNSNNFNLQQSYNVIRNGISEATELIVLKERIKSLQPLAHVSLSQFLQIRIGEKAKLGESVTAYMDIKKDIDKYGDVNMNDVTYEWLNGYVIHKLSGNWNRSGVNSYLASIRAVYKESQRRISLNVKKDNPFMGLIKKTAVKEVIDFTNDDIKKLLGFKGIKGQNDKRNAITMRNVCLWLFQFIVGGHYYVDVSLMEWKDIKGGRWRFKRYKNRNKPDGGTTVNVKLFDVSAIEMYGNKKTKRVFSFIPDIRENERAYRDFSRNVNRSLSSVSKNLDLTSNITTRSPRYVFGSMAASMDISDFTIEEIQGHKHANDRSSYRYRKIDLVAQDRAHKKVLESIGTTLVNNTVTVLP